MRLFKRLCAALIVTGALSQGTHALGVSVFLVNQSTYLAPAGTDVSVPVFLGTSGALSTNLVGGLAVRLSTLGTNGSRIDSVTGNGSFVSGDIDPTPALNVGLSEFADPFATPFGVPLASDGTILIGTFLLRAPLIPGASDTFNVLHFDTSSPPGLFNFLADFTDIEPAGGITFTVRAQGVTNPVPLPGAFWLAAPTLLMTTAALWLRGTRKRSIPAS